MDLTKEEKELLFRIISDVKVNPLDGNAAALIGMLQSIASKTLTAEKPAGDDFDYPVEEPVKKAGKKQP